MKQKKKKKKLNKILSKAKKEIIFHIDQSRINIVESIIFSVGSNIEGKSEEMTEERTGEILSQIGKAIVQLDAARLEIADIVEGNLEQNTNTIKNSAESIEGDLDDAQKSLEEAASEGDDSDNKIDSIDSSHSNLISELNILMDALEDVELNGSAETAYNDVEALLDNSISNNIESLQNLINSINSEIDTSSSSVSDIEESNIKIKNSIAEIDLLIAKLNENIGIIQVKSTEIGSWSGQSIENEYEISINEIVSASDASLFMFPYYLVLLILFVGMMLSSTLVVIERQSQAFFRNYTSPTGSFLHLISRFTSTFIIIALQVSLVLLAVYYYLKIPIFENYPVTLVILILTITLFIFLGYLIGHIFKTQEGITIAFISFGSICAFLSNLILPIETFSHSIRSTLMFNPYMLSSEMLKKSIVFHSSFTSLSMELITLSSYLLSVILAVLFLQELSFSHFTFNLGKRHVLKRPHINSDKHFVLETGQVIEDISQMAAAVKSMDNDELAEYGVGKNNEVALWITDVFKERRLSRKLRKAENKREMQKVFHEFFETKKK